MSTLENNYKKINKFLEEKNISSESSISVPLAPTATIWTPRCTVELYKDEVVVNEVLCEDIHAVTSMIASIEYVNND